MGCFLEGYFFHFICLHLILLHSLPIQVVVLLSDLTGSEQSRYLMIKEEDPISTTASPLHAMSTSKALFREDWFTE